MCQATGSCTPQRQCWLRLRTFAVWASETGHGAANNCKNRGNVKIQDFSILERNHIWAHLAAKFRGNHVSIRWKMIWIMHGLKCSRTFDMMNNWVAEPRTAEIRECRCWSRISRPKKNSTGSWRWAHSICLACLAPSVAPRSAMTWMRCWGVNRGMCIRAVLNRII